MEEERLVILEIRGGCRGRDGVAGCAGRIVQSRETLSYEARKGGRGHFRL